MRVVEDRTDCFERRLADSPTDLLALGNVYRKADRREDEVAVLRRYVAARDERAAILESES